MTRKSKEEGAPEPIWSGAAKRFARKYGPEATEELIRMVKQSQTPPEHDEGSATEGFVRARQLEVYEPGATEPNAKVYVQASAAGTPSQHVHSFVIPVEKRLKRIVMEGGGIIDDMEIVTKLKCNHPGCEAETER